MSIFGCRPVVGAWHRRPTTRVTTGDTTAARVSASTRWGAPTLTLTLRQGSTVITERDVPLTTTWADVALTLTGPECAAITDPSALTITLTKRGAGGRIDVDQLVLSVEGTPSAGGARQVATTLVGPVSLGVPSIARLPRRVQRVATADSLTVQAPTIARSARPVDRGVLAAVVTSAPRPVGRSSWRRIAVTTPALPVVGAPSAPQPRRTARSTTPPALTLSAPLIGRQSGRSARVGSVASAPVVPHAASIASRARRVLQAAVPTVQGMALARTAGRVTRALVTGTLAVSGRALARTAGRVARVLGVGDVSLQASPVTRQARALRTGLPALVTSAAPLVARTAGRVARALGSAGASLVAALVMRTAGRGARVLSPRAVPSVAAPGQVTPRAVTRLVLGAPVPISTPLVTLRVTVLGGVVIGPLSGNASVTGAWAGATRVLGPLTLTSPRVTGPLALQSPQVLGPLDLTGATVDDVVTGAPSVLGPADASSRVRGPLTLHSTDHG